MSIAYGQCSFFFSAWKRVVGLIVLLASVSVLQAGVPQTITFPAIGDRLPTDSLFALSATASSGLAVSYSIVSPAGIATLSGSTVTLTGAPGSVTVKASQAGNGTYSPAPAEYRSFVVGAPFVKIASGSSGYHSAGIKSDGTLWTWGNNTSGQLGDATTVNRARPVQIGPAGTTWIDVTCGSSYTHAIRSDGTLWGWGVNGSSFSGTYIGSHIPVQIGTATNWTTVAAGSSHTLALRSDGTLWAWGNNSSGQLGDGTSAYQLTPVQIWGNGWKAIACGAFHSLALQTDGTLWAWGYNGNGQVASGRSTTSFPFQLVPGVNTWTAIACGREHSIALRADGSMWAWGANGSGQLGMGNTSSLSVVTRLGTGTAWTKIAAGRDCTTAVRSDGTLWAWGDNNYGQLGDGTRLPRTTPAQIGTASTWSTPVCGAYHTLALRTDGRLWGWGDNRYGQLGNSNDWTVPMSVQPGSAWTQVAAFGHTAAVRADGTLWTWGANESGQLGDGTNTVRYLPVLAGSDASWRAVACGTAHTAALRTDGTLWTWGSNTYGQLGSGSTTSRTSPAQVGTATHWTAVACGENYAAALRGDGTLWTWGSNTYGQLGDGSTTNRTSPVQIGTATSWTAVACGYNHTLALRSDGSLWTWGSNSWGQLGDSTGTSRLAPVRVGTATTWTAIAGGGAHSLALRSDGTLWSWGYNEYGQLGNGDLNFRMSPTQAGTATAWAAISAGKTHSIATRTDGSLWTWGRNEYSQLGQVSASGSIISPSQLGALTSWGDVCGGSAHSAVLGKDGTLWTWGRLENGSLGTEDSAVPSDTRAARGPSAQTINFPPPAIPAQGQPISLAATASSGLTVTYTVTGPAGLVDGFVIPTGNGRVVVTAQQAGDAAWLPAGPRKQEFTYMPAITLSGGGQPIASGSTQPSATNRTDFGSYAGTPAASRTFTLTNTGNADLLVSGVTLGGPHAADFSLISSPASAPLAPGASTSFKIGFAPAAADLRTATVSLVSNAPAVTFTIQGTDAASQLITFPLVAMRRTTDAPLTLAASSTSGLPLKYTVVSTGGVATVSGNVLTFTGTPGAVTLRVSQAGDGTHHSALDVFRTFLVASPSQLFTQIADSYHCAAIASNGTLWTWGRNGDGQLGDGATTDRNRPVQIGTATTWTAVACGEAHTVALRSNGTLWTWGRNTDGQLGDGTTTSRSAPVQMGTNTTWTAISSGGRHVLARRADGTLWAWGDNTNGQLGDGTQADRSTPVQIGAGATWTAFSCSFSHSLAVRAGGTLWGWGRLSPLPDTPPGGGGGGGGGTIIIGTGPGWPTTDPTPTPTPVLAGTSATPVQIGTATTWTTVACGGGYSAALRADGTLWTLGGGNTDFAKIGTDNRWAGISCGGSSQVHCRRTDGTLWALGINYSGELGDGTVDARYEPVQVGTATNWSAAADGISHSLGLRADGSLWAWGYNGFGQLGQGVTSAAFAPIAPEATRPGRVSPLPSAQTLTFPALPATVTVGQAVTLAATASSGLPVSYAVTGPATLSGNILTPTGLGSITVTASQVDEVWLPAQPVTYTLQVQGTPQQSWRQAHFGTAVNSGMAADMADMDHDGLANLIEYAFDLNPVAGGPTQLPQAVKNGGNFTVDFEQPAGVTGVVYGASYSPNMLPGSWIAIPDTGTGGRHVFSAPVGVGDAKMFIRLEVAAGP